MTMTALQKERKEKENRYRNIGVTIRQVGIGDGIQYTSLPENFYKKTGQKLIDVSKPWYFDDNPFVLRDIEPKKTIELWNYPPNKPGTLYDWPHLRDSVYLSNAEIHLAVMGLRDPHLIRPRLYRYENFPFEWRERVLFHPFGRSHGALPDHIIQHVITKYRGTGELYQIGLPTDPDLGIKRIHTATLWELSQTISQARMLIGVDSGPSWIAACYPDVIIKKIRTQFQFGYCEPKDWVPLDVKNSHSFWDDRVFQIFNTFEEDVGFTYSYNKL